MSDSLRLPRQLTLPACVIRPTEVSRRAHDSSSRGGSHRPRCPATSHQRREGDSNPRRLAPRGFSRAPRRVNWVSVSPLTLMYLETGPVGSISFDRNRPNRWLGSWLEADGVDGAGCPCIGSV